MRQCFSMVFVAMYAVSALADEKTDKNKVSDERAKVVVTGRYDGGFRSSVGIEIRGKSVSRTVAVWIVKLDEKTSLLAYFPDVEKLDADLEKKFNTDLSELTDREKILAITGRLTVEEDESHGGKKDIAGIDADKLLTLGKDKRLVLVVESIVALDAKNKSAFPALGKVYLEGGAICGNRDLKLFEETILAVKNGLVPIILKGDKGQKEVFAKGRIGVAGSLQVDERKLVRVQAEEVKVLESK